MAYCPNTSLKEWKDLVSAQGENLSYFLWDKYKGNVPSMFYVNSQGVSYTPKVVSALLKAFENRKTIRVATDGQKTNIRKYLAGQGVPSDQIDLMFSYLDYTGQTEAKTDDLIVDMLSSYSYAIEINTATQDVKDAFGAVFARDYPNKKIGDSITIGGENWVISGIKKETDPDDWGDDLPKIDAFVLSKKGRPISYYSNLTVPGGANYTEQEIATPEITPNIKGHAQFATDKGIGWFRSDDRQVNLGGAELSEEYAPNIEQLSNGKWEVSYMPITGGRKLEFFKTEQEAKDFVKSITKTSDEKTRRILEVQSDLFQKGRSKAALVYNTGRNDANLGNVSSVEEIPVNSFEKKSRKHTFVDYYYKKDGQWYLTTPSAEGTLIKNKSLIVEAYNKSLAYYEVDRTKENQFLQLLNKDNNWVTFFVKSIIQDSAKKGYEKVLFPSGDTASKVEGHTTLEDFKQQKQDKIKQLENTLEELKSDEFFDKTYFIHEKGIYKKQSLYDNPLDSGRAFIKNVNSKEQAKEIVYGSVKKDSENEINQLKQELERVEGPEGFGALKPIYNFYQNTVSAVLKKQGFAPKTVTDEYGNKWFEVDLTTPKIAEKTSSAIAFRTSAQATGAATINTEKAKAWVEQRFGKNSVSIFESVEAIGNEEVHGYVENGLMHLWSAAEVGTEFHEGYHLVFRGMLSEEQREALYAEAEQNFGKPTASELAALKEQFPNISDEELYKLALEEKMAEEFREYMLAEGEVKSLPSRIAKFFKDLWNFLKAIMTDGLSLKQTYSLIASNKMNSTLLGRGVFRNSEKFKGNNRANLTRPGFGPEAITDATDILYTKFLKIKKRYNNPKNPFNETRALGEGDNKGSIANSLLVQLYENQDGSPLTKNKEGAVEILNAEIAFYENKTDENREAFFKALEKHNAKLGMTSDPRKRTLYKNIYTSWWDTVEKKTENVIEEGWRSALTKKLRDAGIYIDAKERKDSNESNPEMIDDPEAEAMNEDFAAINEAVNKIFGQSNMEINPSKRLTGRVKELLASIEGVEENSFGEIVMMDREEVFKELLNIFSGKQTYSQMLAAIRQAVKLKPNFKPVLTFLEKLDAPERAMIFSAFALNSSDFILLRQVVEQNDKGENISNYTQVFNSNRKDIPTAMAEKWRNSIVSETEGGALYFLQTITKGEGENETQEQVISIDKVRFLRAAAAYKEMEKLFTKNPVGKLNVNVGRINGEINPIVESLGKTMFELGLYLGSDTHVGDTIANLQNIADVGEAGTNGTMTMLKVADELRGFLKKIGVFTISKSSELGDFESVRPTGALDYLSAEKSKAIGFATIFKDVLKTAGISFVNSKGKAIYATSTETHMTQIVNTLKGGNAEAKALYEMYMSDPFNNGGGNPAYASILLRHIANPMFLKEWGVYDFDAAKGAADYDDALAYEDLSVADNLVVKINAFINGRADSPLTYAGVPTQADRDKFTLMGAPRLAQNHYKMQFATYNELLKAQIVQDLLRVAAAKKAVQLAEDNEDFSNLIEGYHTAPGNPTAILSNLDGPVSEREYLGNAFKNEFFQLTAKLDGVQIVTDATIRTEVKQNGKLQLSDVIESYVSGKASTADKADIDKKLNDMVAKLDTYFTDQAQKVKAALVAAEKIDLEKPLEGEIGTSGIPSTSNLDQTLKGFVIEQVIMKNEMVKLFRGNRAMTKNIEDFYKRMGHLTTPGTKMAMKGEVGSPAWLDEDYGMMKEFNEVVMRDIRMDLTPKQIEEAEAIVENIKLGLVKSGIPLEEAETIANNYLPNNYDSTDAQAYISLEMHRGIMQGLGKWGKEEEAAYQAYEITGKFVYQAGAVPEGYEAGEAVPILPHKGYFESLAYDSDLNVVYPDSQKNSYSVLIKSYTENFPHMEDLRQRMEAKGNYAGQTPIHVVNFVSGKKLAKRGVYKHSGVIGSLGDIVVNKYDSGKLRFPQFIPSPKEDPKNALNRQIKKNMVANVKDGTNYFLSPGIENILITGQDLKGLYHAAIEEKLNRDMEKVKSELKISDLEKAIGTNDVNQINEAKLDVLKAVREIILKQAVEKELHSNYEKALNIQFDSEGTPQFAVPLDLPLYNKKYESIIMSLVNNNVFKQKVKGFEGVQIAQLGGSEADGSGALKFMQISENGDRVIHAEIMIREDVARQFGIDPGKSLDEIPEELRRIIGYRIPNADKGATVILKIAKFLPAGYGKSVVVPGQLTKLMGSDFDVDKLNLLFPEVDVDKKAGTIVKTKVPYNEIIASKNLKNLSTKQLHNIILDSMEAVYSNPAHFKEVFTPLDDDTLKAVRDDIRKAVPALAEQTDWNDFNTELLTALRNTLGNKLRGIYANALAARNVLQHGTVNIEKASAIIIDGEEFTEYVKDVYLDINDKSKGTIPSDKALALWLSAAVDAAKTPLQYELNDTVLTSRIRILFAAYYPEYSSGMCSYFLNQPLIRQFTEYFENTHSGNLMNLKDAYTSFVATQGFTGEAANYVNYESFPATQPMSSKEILNLKTDARDINEQAKMLGNFMKFYTAGRMLMKLNKRVTPDSMDGMGRIGSIQSYQDRANAFEVDEEGDFGKQVFFRGPDADKNVVDQFIGEDSVFGLERGYENLLGKALNFSSILFGTRLSSSFLNFKQALKKNAKVDELNAEMHQLVDYNLMFMMLMKEGSPFKDLLTNMDGMYSDPNNNIFTQLQALKTKFPGLAQNKFVANIEKDYVTQPTKKGQKKDKFGKNYYGIKFDNTFSYSVPEKEKFTQGLRDMLYNPEFFVPDGNQEGATEIKEFATKLAMHSFFANGFRQGASSYADIVPIEFFTSSENGKSITNFFREEASKAIQGDYFDTSDLLQYMAMFGKMRAGGSNLLKRQSNKYLNKDTKKLHFGKSDPFVVVRNNKSGMSAVFMKVDTDDKGRGVYVIMEGTLATKGMSKLAGAIAMNAENQLSNPVIAEYVTIHSEDFQIDRKKQLPESGAMACII